MSRADDPDASAATVAAPSSTPATSPTLLAPSGTQPREADPAAGTRASAVRSSIDPRYALGEVIGRGGMGEVLLAHDERVGRDVAIKRLRTDGAAAPEAVGRFLREARVQGRLDHPAIVPVHDLGTDAAGVPYFAMKRLTGITLATILDRLAAGDSDAQARWPRRLLLARLAEICLAVHFAHTRGVVHRDLKPHNVMLGDFGEVYVLDWGIAKIADDDLPAAASGTIRKGDLDTLDSVSGETAAGAVLGTPGYMPPEQLRGGAIDQRVDVYALGCMLFEILALQGALPRGAAAFEATLTAKPMRPAARRPELEIPPELDDATARATAPDPADRLASARDLHDEIQRYLDGDRDLARRKELAGDHAAAAVRALDAGARPEAMREAGRALALDPANRAAQGVVGQVLLEPPDQIPPEVTASIEADRVKAGHAQLQIGALVYLSYLLFVPGLALWLDVRDWTVPILTIVLSVLSAGLTYAMTRRSSLRGWIYVALLMDSALVGMVGVIVSPLVLVPTLAIGSLTSFLAQPMQRQPLLVIAAGFVSILWPLVLEWTGVLPRTYAIVDGALVIRPWVVDLSQTGTLVMLVGVGLATALAAGSLVLHLRIAQEAAEERVHLLAWHMRQLMPDATPGAATATPTAAPPPPSRSPARTP